MKLRAAELQDAPEIARLSGELGYSADPKVIARRLRTLLRSATDKVLVAESSSGLVVGWVHGFLSQLIESNYRVEIGGLVVVVSERRQGIGRRLVAEIETWAKARGAMELSVRCRDAREEAHRFYECIGYRCVKTQRVFRKPIPAV